MTETHFGSSKDQIAHAVSLDTNHANAFVAAGVENALVTVRPPRG